MDELFSQLIKLVEENQETVLITIISSLGSTPRSEGARMLVSKAGRVAGTVGGGAVEFRSEQVAKIVLKTKTPMIEKFVLAPNEEDDLGMICGGNVDILFQFISPEDTTVKNFYRQYNHCKETDQNCWLIAELEPKLSNTLQLYDREHGFSNHLSYPVKEEDFSRKPLIVSRENRNIFIEPLMEFGKVYVFGSGHVAQALVPVLKRVNFYCVVADDRKEFLSKDYFPNADERLWVDLENIDQSIELSKDDYAVVMTRGHQFDFELAKQLLKTKVKYIGVMGSKRKVAVQIDRLKKCGFTQTEIEQIHMPIGIKMRAETPAELAISIAGELINKRAEK